MCHSAKKIRRVETFSVSLISGIEEFFASEAYVTIFEVLSKFFCLTLETIFVGEPFSVSIISGIENVWIRGWRVSIFSVEIFCLSVPKIL